MPKPYPPEFARHALDMVASGRTVVDVAADLPLSLEGPRTTRRRPLGPAHRDQCGLLAQPALCVQGLAVYGIER